MTQSPLLSRVTIPAGLVRAVESVDFVTESQTVDAPRAAPGRSVDAVSGGVDHDVVAELRQEVSDLLALRLRETPVADPRARRELARAILSDALVARSRARVHAGQAPWSVDQEFALADAKPNR